MGNWMSCTILKVNARRHYSRYLPLSRLTQSRRFFAFSLHLVGPHQVLAYSRHLAIVTPANEAKSACVPPISHP